MIFLFRLIVVVILGILVCIVGTIFCLFNPRNPNNVARFAHIFSAILTPLFGIKVITRESKTVKDLGSVVYIANHQNNFDILVGGDVFQKRTVTVGKKSLAWIPFFGQLYYLTGNILIDRDNKSKARNTLSHVINEMDKKGISIWMFPEGTRSRGRGLLPFKTGAFRTAIAAGVPIVPICISNTNNIKLNRWNNGFVVVEMLEPIETKDLTKEDVKIVIDQCYQLMSQKIAQLDDEAQCLNHQKS